VKLFRSKEEKQQIAEARGQYTSFVQAVSQAEPEQALALVRSFKSQVDLGALSDREQREYALEAYRAYAENVLADDHLTEAEEEAFGAIGDALGLTTRRSSASSATSCIASSSPRSTTVGFPSSRSRTSSRSETRSSTLRQSPR